jgi:hypothetical protein
MIAKARPLSTVQLEGEPQQRECSASRLLQIAMPLGGIGTGCICLNGYGGLQDFSIRGRPATTAMPDGHGETDAAFAVLHIKRARGAQSITRLVEGPLPPEKIYDQSLQAQGYRKGGFDGLPRFAECRFQGEYTYRYIDVERQNFRRLGRR